MKEKILEKEYIIDGMDCADCARHLEDAVMKVNGIKKADINFVTAKMRITSDGVLVSDDLINKAVKSAGYKVVTQQADIKASKQSIRPVSPWQSVHNGALRTPVASAFP